MSQVINELKDDKGIIEPIDFNSNNPFEFNIIHSLFLEKPCSLGEKCPRSKINTTMMINLKIVRQGDFPYEAAHTGFFIILSGDIGGMVLGFFAHLTILPELVVLDLFPVSG